MRKIFVNIADGTAVKVEDGIIKKIGEETSSFLKGDEIVDCGGNYLYEAFADRHAHLSILALEFSTLNLSMADSIEKLADMIKNFDGNVVVGRGWDESLWHGEMPDRKFLDSIEPNRPVFLIRVDGHMAVLNTKAWEIYRADGDSSKGYVYEEEVGRILSKISVDRKNGLRKALEFAVKEGIVEIHEMGGGVDWFWEIAQQKPKIDIRYYMHREWDRMDEIPRKVGNIKLEGIKAFADGSIGAKTAAVSTGYTDGKMVEVFMKREKIRTLGKFAEDKGLKLAVHAIGDLAIKEAVEGLKDLNGNHRIEHFELVPQEYLENPEILQKITVCMQPNFLRWAFPGGLYEKNIGKFWAERCNPFALLEGKINLIFGSDSMPLSPRFGLKMLLNPPSNVQKLDINTAMKHYRRCKIAEGNEASFILVDKPLPEGNIMMTVFKGNIVFQEIV